ncbi:hypothetical protein [Providencia sneebia]|uniref:YdgH/BhsA/McbA-like domain-containing protein n=1 Tax=Providencia sneebia DSM 19967 TaxID=1141660 RepID=K8WF98_9GAMM|nr:hypothetical protein [Providencia sneebia]EKT58611.1 hypothetical protein OO7_07864 [Providencia sneebia DSM 19967]
MKIQLIPTLFMVIALSVSASICAQGTEFINLNESIQAMHSLHKIEAQDSGDIESLREMAESNQLEISESIMDRRFNGRQFRIISK